MTVRYLRVSVTDRCDLRCAYCSPMRSPGAPRADLLTYEEIVEVVRVLAGMGVRKVRLTGGEPLRRPGLAWLLREVARVPGLEDLGLTTNGTALDPFIPVLVETGFRLNVHLDTLDPVRYREVMGGKDPHAVAQAVRRAVLAGIPTKINAVVTASTPERDALALIEFGREVGTPVRFIEAMPVSGLEPDTGARAAMEALEATLRKTQGLVPASRDGQARMYRGARGERVGFITPSHARFCDGCDKVRLTSRGRLKACLFENGGADLRPFLRGGDAQGLSRAVAAVLGAKAQERLGSRIESMVGIGG